jgi:metallo-beta-lactamase class B
MLRMLVSIVAAAALAGAQGRDYEKAFPAHKVVGNTYFVGNEALGTYLITTPEGHILINSDFERTVPQIRAGVEKLGFKFNDIKILLGSHAHGDHMEADALVKELSGARVMHMEQDLPLLRKMMPKGKPHPVDRVLKDGDTVALGGTTLTAHLTPGHTPGCTTWTWKTEEAGKTYDVVMVCSVGVNAGYVLVGNKDYPQIAEDYVKSFKILRALPGEIFIAAHGNFYNMEEKFAKVGKTQTNPFLDRAGYLAYIDEKERDFHTRLAEQKKAAVK